MTTPPKDLSELHPQLMGLEGRRVRVIPPRRTMTGHNQHEFIVGRSTGWRPCHLAMRQGAIGSAEVIKKTERFAEVRVVGNRLGRFKRR